MSFTIQARESNGVTVLDLYGRLVLGEPATALRDTIRLYGRDGARLVLNLAGVTYIDSAGLGELVGCHLTIRDVGGEMRVVHLHERVQVLLKLMRLEKMFHAFESEEQAIMSFAAAMV